MLRRLGFAAVILLATPLSMFVVLGDEPPPPPPPPAQPPTPQAPPAPPPPKKSPNLEIAATVTGDRRAKLEEAIAAWKAAEDKFRKEGFAASEKALDDA